MEQKVKYKRRLADFLTEKEKEEIAERIISFMKKCLRISDYISTTDDGKKYKHYYYYFEEGDTKFGDGYYNRIYEKNEKYEIEDLNLFYDFDVIGGMFERFKYHIRMNGSPAHIKKLIELLGDKVAVIYFEAWAKKNVAVGILLNEVVKSLKDSQK